jgi:uncharacterized membrane protein YqiK
MEEPLIFISFSASEWVLVTEAVAVEDSAVAAEDSAVAEVVTEAAAVDAEASAEAEALTEVAEVVAVVVEDLVVPSGVVSAQAQRLLSSPILVSQVSTSNAAKMTCS